MVEIDPFELLTLTDEEKATEYSSALDCATLINDAIANPDNYTDDPTAISRNVEHLKMIVSRPYWTDEDMTPLNDAIAAGEAV